MAPSLAHRPTRAAAAWAGVGYHLCREVIEDDRRVLAFVVTAAATGGRSLAQGTTTLRSMAMLEDPPVTLTEIEAALSAYGSWAEIEGVGRVWRPDVAVVGEEFAPYVSNGQWVNSAYGWTFNSTAPWGWAAFHFGRWLFAAEQGWVWTAAGVGVGSPASWGPAWVDWRTGNGLVGWVASPPDGAPVDPHQYASLWNVARLRDLPSRDLPRRLIAPDRAAYLKVASPPCVGAPVAPMATWRGYPGLRAALAANSAGLVTVIPPGTNPILWLGVGSSVHAPIGMGYPAGASQVWTGPGSSVFASPAFAEPAGRPLPPPSSQPSRTRSLRR